MKLSSEKVERRDVLIGTIIALAMGVTFTLVGGKPLVVTFLPGLVITWGIFLWMHRSRAELPTGASLYPIYFATLAWQFVHFTEEFASGFAARFFPLYGHPPITDSLFVGINMLSYFGFTVGFLLAFALRWRFFLVPTIFFVINGALGNAIAHVWWVILARGYFPGFFTALGYWIIGPIALCRLVGSRKRACVIIGIFTVTLVPLLTFTRG